MSAVLVLSTMAVAAVVAGDAQAPSWLVILAAGSVVVCAWAHVVACRP